MTKRGVEVALNFQVSEVQVMPTTTLNRERSQRRGVGWWLLYCLILVSMPITIPLGVLYLIYCFVVGIFGPEESEEEQTAEMERKVKEELETFVAKSRARMQEIRRAAVFEKVLQRDVQEARAEFKYRWSTVFAYLFRRTQAHAEYRFFDHGDYRRNYIHGGPPPTPTGMPSERS